MSAALHILVRDDAGVPIGAGNTRWLSPTMGPFFQNNPEAVAAMTVRAAGTYSNMYLRVVVNSTTASSTLTSRKNAAAGAQSITIPSATTGEFEDTVNSDSVAVADTFNYQIVNGGGGGLNLSIASGLFTASTNTYVRYRSLYQSTPSASTTYYSGPSGSATYVTTEANEQLKMKNGGTLQHLAAYALVNGRTTSDTVRSRKNGADGNLTLTITGSTTGLFEDTSNSDAFVADDLLNTSLTTGTGTGDLEVYVSLGVTTTDGTVQMAAHDNIGGESVAPSVTRYFGVGGGIFTAFTTEANARAEVQYAPTASKLEAYLSANTVTGNSTLRLRIDGANGNQVATLTGLTTGWFEDTSGTDVLTAAQEINYSLVTGAGGTSMTLQTLAMLLTVAAALVPIPGNYFPDMVRGKMVPVPYY